MDPKKIAMIFYIIALNLAAIGIILSLIGYGLIIGSILFVYSPIILIALGLLLPMFIKE